MFVRDSQISIALLLLIVGVGAADDGDAQKREFFEEKIRPILVDKCVNCHGAKKKESGLRLDSRTSILKGGDNGAAALPGLPAESLLMDAIRQRGNIKMPPNDKLEEAEILAIESWIQQGIYWPPNTPLLADNKKAREHWAFQPVKKIEPPPIKNEGWTQTDLDRFIMQKLESAELEPAPPADRQTLIRRATFDLTGLPPTPEEVAAFENDEAPDALAKLIDRLLDSPYYGERWGRYWLDVARYADNKGYVFFEDKNFPWAWTYRDWVIRAFNEDLPYDQFVLQQLAADQLKLGEDRRALAAMGFLTIGAHFTNNTHDQIDDRIDVVTRGLMGLTVTCARCHDHKFDPIPQADYYSLYGVFASSLEPTVPPLFTAKPTSNEYIEYEKGLNERIEKLDRFVAEQRNLIMAGARARADEYLLAVYRDRNHPSTENFMLLTDKGAITPAVIHRWKIYLEGIDQSDDPVWSIWHQFSELPEENFAETAKQLHTELFAAQPSGQKQSARATANSILFEEFRAAPPATMEEVAKTYGTVLKKIDEQWKASLQSAAEQRAAVPVAFDDADKEQLRQVLYGMDSPAVIPRLLGWGFLDLLPDRPTQGEFQKLLTDLEQFSKGPAGPPRAMVLEDAEQPYDPVIFQRGNPNQRGKQVPRQFPELISSVISTEARQPFSSGSGRLEMARAIVDPRNPLTARVYVNRVWLHHFGRGLVETPSDFGLQGGKPSHPELLDWLASWFIENGWSTKKLHRLIMMSAVYQQSSNANSTARERGQMIDPNNLLLSHFNRQRLDFESMRDAMLAATGALDRTLGGPAVNLLDGFQPRRTVYGFINRMDLPGLLRTFDYPEPAATSPKRDQTTVPSQALFFLNHQFVSDCAARILSRQDVSSLNDSQQRVQRVYHVLFGRAAEPEELLLAMSFLDGSQQPAGEPTWWKYGYGSVDATTKRVASFTELTYWTGLRWQAGPALPDPELGWVFIDRNGGHPAATDERCSIRRWISPFDGKISIAGLLKHAPPEGNGVRGRIVSSRDGILGEWKVKNSEAKTEIASIEIHTGDTIDLVVDFQGEITHDEHIWEIKVNETSPDNGQPHVWDSVADFRGQRSNPWQEFVQALLMTNEFVFVD